MGLFESFGGLKVNKEPEIVSSKELLRDGIAKQKKSLNKGDHLNKSDKELRILKAIWFKNGSFAPYVGQHLLFGKQSVRYDVGKEREVLAELENALDRNDEELIGYLSKADKARKATKVKAAQTRKNKKTTDTETDDNLSDEAAS